MRDAVISLVQHSDIEQLADPKMEYLKSELVIAINRVLQGQVIKDVAFSEFSLGPG
jgi:flagellar basal body-associated protein FliL